MTEYVGRKLSLDEEIEIYQKEAKELFDNEQKGCETPFANCIVRRGMRIIRKSKEIREKHTPKKPIEKEVIGASTTGYKYKGQCPKCSSTVSQYIGNYCHHCGQALDWSDDNDL